MGGSSPKKLKTQKLRISLIKRAQNMWKLSRMARTPAIYLFNF
jgi:hypothetical protein